MTLPIPTPSSPPPSDLAEAVSAAQNAPDKPDLWDEAERLAGEHQRPEDVAFAYDLVVHGEIGRDVALELCERSIGFLSEWFEESAGVPILMRAIEIDAGADWAFRRLTMQLTVDRRWDELLSLYDRVIAGTTDDKRRAELYGEAAQMAKDLAGRADRAITYLEALSRLTPSDDHIAGSLERLLEREGRWRELVDLWRSHLGDLDGAAAQARRAQIAACLLDKLASPGEALEEAQHLFAGGGVVAAVEIYERVFAFPSADAEVRKRAMTELSAHYSKSGKTADVIRVLTIALGHAERDGDVAGRAPLHRRIAELYIGEGREEEALDHIAALLSLDPEDEVAAQHLEDLGKRTGRLDRWADALAHAADAAEARAANEPPLATRAVALLFEAARVRADEIKDPAGATGLYARIFHRDGGVDDATMLEVCRRLDGLLAGGADRATRLDVLERRGALEPAADGRRRLRAEAAQLAEALGDPGRALRSWELVLAADAGDREAHEAVIAILEREGKDRELIAALTRSASSPGARDDARAHRVRAAKVHAERLDDPEAAIAAWKEIEEQFGQSEETIDELCTLLGAAERYEELATVLEHGLELTLDPVRRQSFLQQLGDLHRGHTKDLERALQFYAAVIAENPAHPGARAGMTALLDDAGTRARAAELLLHAFEETGDWAGRLSLLEHRLAAAKGVAAKTALLLEAADLHEHRANDRAAALGALARALPLTPDDTGVEARLLALAETTGGWQVAADALDKAVDACESPERAAELHFQRGTVLEARLADVAGALGAYLAASALAEERLDVAAAAVRAATHEKQWDVAARTLVSSTRARGAVDAGLLEALSAPQAWDEAAAALGAAVDADEKLPAKLAAEILRTVAVWHRDQRADAASAEQVLLRALARAGGGIDTLEMLAGVQRGAPGRPLVDTLLKLAEAGHEALASLREAAGVALDTLGDAALSRTILEQLLLEVQVRLDDGEQGLDDLAAFAVSGLVRLAEDAGDPSRAVSILVDAASLPLGLPAARARLHEAAAIAEERLHDADRAVALYRRVLKDTPGDARALTRLSAIFEGADRIDDLLALRRHELGLADGPEARIALRLSIASLLGRAGDAAGRVAALRDNLADEAGHEQSLEELAGLLESDARHADLATLLEEQATLLTESGEAARAADLWTRASEIAEDKLANNARALQDRRRAAEGKPTAETFDALARLSIAAKDHAAAVGWLEKRLAALDPEAAEARIATVARLAEALGGAGRKAEARASLERALGDHPGAEALRAPLRDLYRAEGAWDELVTLLGAAREGEAARVDELREAAEICLRKLNSRERAIPILEGLVALAPTDRPARLTLAGALRGAGDLERAKTILNGLLEEYGRRRSPERAEVHFQLAQVAAAGGNGPEAQTQLETATSMSKEHPGALRMLAGLYRDAGDLERAERMYGALLLIALRQKPGDDDADRPARSEVMINLHWLLSKLQQKGRADEMLQSAFEAARLREFEARRLMDALREAGDHALLLRALEERLAHGDLSARDRAVVLSDMAEALGGPLDRPDDAFKALLNALELDPGSAALRDRAAGMARRAGAIGRWAEVLAKIADHAEEEGKAPLAAGLSLSLGEIQERDLHDNALALSYYQRAERLGAEPVPTWRAIDRAAGAVGDTGEQIRVLRQLASAGDGDAAALTEDIYRLAELELASPGDLSAGLASLEWALSREARHDRAGRMLRGAAESGSDPGVLAAYERVARASGDPAMLLDALDRVAMGGISMELAREATELALAAGDAARIDRLLARAVEIGEGNPAGMAEAVWALVKLADRREESGDVSGAIGFLTRAVEAAEHEEAQRHTARAVGLALDKLQNPRMAAEAWERLLTRDRHDREVWQPLLDLYRRIGDQQVLADKLREAIECAFDAAWRSALRVERAKLLAGQSPDDAAADLDEVLSEDPENEEAAALLTRIYEQQGREDKLAELMERQLSLSRSHNDAASQLQLSLKLGAILAKDRPEQAIDVYRAALDASPESMDLLGRLLALFAGEERLEDRAEILERMLKLSSGREAAERAIRLADLRQKLDDADGAVRSLEIGFRADPTMTAVRDRLASLYATTERWVDLAGMLEVEGAALAGPEGASRLREAASLYLDRMERPADAARALGMAQERDPGNVPLLVELARCLERAGDRPGAVERLSQTLDRGVSRAADRVSLLRLRAELSTAPEEQDRALADLDAAYRLDPKSVAKDLADALEPRLAAPPGSTDRGLLRRLVDVLLDLGDLDRVRMVIGDWISRDPGDTLVIVWAAEIEGYSGRWDSAVELCERLVGLLQGNDRVQAAQLAVGAYTQSGSPHDARNMLETVFAESPHDARIRDPLKRIYEEQGAFRELANLYMHESSYVTDPAERFAALRKAGSLLLEQAGDPAAAIPALEAARELRPKDHEVTLALADAYIHAGKLQEAADFIDSAIQAQKGRRSREVSSMQHRMATIARAVGDRQNELAWLNAAFESDAQNGEAAASLADVATEFGQLEVALKALKAITLMKNPKPITRAMAYLRQAMIAQHQGDVRKAAMLAKKAQSEDPNLEEAGAFLAQLSGS